MILDISMTLENRDGGLMLERVTSITVDDEIRLLVCVGAMDHIGDENPSIITDAPCVYCRSGDG